MAEPTATAAVTATAGESQDLSGFTLVVVSPSTGVSGPLTFHNVQATTTIKEVKLRIRDAIPSKPADHSQRLIHQGRLMSRETETMLDIFGQEALTKGVTKTLHLVLRDTTPTPSATAGPQRPTPVVNLPQAQPTPVYPFQGVPRQQPLPGFHSIQQTQALHAQHIHRHQQQNQAPNFDSTQSLMTQRLAQLQQETRRLHQEMIAIEQRSRALAAAAQQQQLIVGQQGALPPQMMPASIRNLIAQQQQDRATVGRQGVQDNNGMPSPFGQPLSGRSSPSMHRPDHSTTTTRESIGPNGERWSVTVNETTSSTLIPLNQPLPNHQPGQPIDQHPALAELQDILRNADRHLPTQNLQNGQNNMERASSNPLPRVPTPAGATSAVRSSTATPAATQNPFLPFPMTNGPASAQAFTAPVVSHVEPVVYLLSSPAGPRALLLNNADTFFSPRPSSRRRRMDASNVANAEPNPNNPPPAPAPAPGFPEYRNRGLRPRRAHRNRQENNPVPVNAAAAHANPGAGAMAAQLGPIVWLIVRLVGFVWFFTAGNPSWTRWLMVSALAVVVFIINTGVANGIFEQLWGPIRRHVEALIPLAGPEAAQIPAINAAIPRPPPAEDPPVNESAASNAGVQPQRRRRGELDPAEVAAHLIEQHRQRNAPGWLMTQIRRAEHSMLLFLASLVPGVGERHIAAREAEANAAEAERQRRIDAAAAAENSAGGDQPNESAAEGSAAEGSAAEGSAASATEGQIADGGEQPQNGGEAPAPVQPQVDT